jgi:hypothetical protein
MSDTVSTNIIKAQMPHPVLTHVLGEPTHKQLNLILRKLTTNLMAVSCPGGHNKGHLGLLQDPALYLAHNVASFGIPAAKPPLYLVVPAGATTHQRKELRAQNTSARKAWTTYHLVCAITRNQFGATIVDVFYAVLNNLIKGLNGIGLRMLAQHIATTYTQISQPNLGKNLAGFNTGIDLGLTLSVYTRKQERCQVFALNTAVPISKATMVTTGTKHALACGNMTMAWREWNHRAIINHTWPNWKTHWKAAFAEMGNINRMMAGKAAFDTNAAKEEHQAHQITASHDNLANALIEKNATIDSLVAFNAQLVQALQQMQAALVRMFPTGQTHAQLPYQPRTWVPTPPEAAAPPAAPPAPTPAMRGPRQSHWGSVKPAWDKQGYCWSHGHKVKVGHTSATCSSQCKDHQPGATQANTMGRSIYNMGYPFRYRTTSSPDPTMQNSGLCCR